MYATFVAPRLKKEAFPAEKIDSVLNKTNVIWSKMNQVVTADLIAHRCANIPYVALCHQNPYTIYDKTAIYT